jgi:hypothetical protein
MRAFIYDVLAPTVGVFYWPFYPATIVLSLYVSSVVSGNFAQTVK